MPGIKFTKAAVASLGLRADEKEQFYFDAASRAWASASKTTPLAGLRNIV
jgi:hypothetical protein